MVSRLILGFILVTAFSIVGMTVNSEGITPQILAFGTDGAPGLFCEVEKADVCVLARSEEDCTKLGGVKAEKCEAPENEGE
jgi:hypothetical protein